MPSNTIWGFETTSTFANKKSSCQLAIQIILKFEIIKEYHENKGESLSHQEIQSLEKNYRQNEPEQFLAMYDAIRDNIKNKEE